MTRVPEREVIPLWPEGAPGSETWTQVERASLVAVPPGSPGGRRHVRNVTQPTLTAFLPPAERATGTAVIVCPGGAHHALAVDHEGAELAEWLVERGIAAFLLKYRLLPSPASDPEFELRFWEILSAPEQLPAVLTPEHLAVVRADGQRAVATVRARAAEWRLAADRIGILGFSAGGSVAIAVGLDHDGASRPDFVAGVYAGIWEELRVPADAPPMFLALATDDQIGERIVGTAVRVYEAWRQAGRPVELHAYATGGHGFGMTRQGLPIDTWPDRLLAWLEQQGFVGPGVTPA
jgi:acetyl esterase/lipase